MQAIAGDLALAKSPVSDTDLQLYILNHLGEDYRSIISALRVRNSATTMLEFSQILTDHERSLKDSDDGTSTLIPTAHVTQRRSPSSGDTTRRNSPSLLAQRTTSQNGFCGSTGSTSRTPHTGGQGRSSIICNFCNFAGHIFRDCRKLARFLR
ncbi:unnamed protein product [Cuscuta epithymum]|uniref:CCHC-type domain-containing protein n=1 Tax=Cuscuta epithymum TaxID=186058 RepID=A0AAV0GKD2_9ASTE|nr:unnamed protein product [Cuscuta epithymum]